MEWFVLIIPFLFTFVGILFFSREIHKLEIGIPLIVSLLFLIVFKAIAIRKSENDIEYIGSKVIKAEYFEEWDEWVHQTCYRTISCGKNCTTTIPYDCSYRRYNAPHWQITDEYNNITQIEKSDYKKLVKQFKNESFKDLNRDYYTIDGNKYVTYWNNDYLTIENTVTKHAYINKPQACKNLFHYEELSDSIKSTLYDYPKINGYKQQHLIGYDNLELSKELDRINGFLAKEKELKLFLLIYQNKTEEISFQQEAFWKGGNKNEFIITLGIDSNKITWCRIISWTENQYCKLEVKKVFIEQPQIECLHENILRLIPILRNNYERKEFSDFDYLNVPLTKKQITWLYIISILINILIMVIILKNEVRE